MKIKIRPITATDLPELWQITFSDPNAEWTRWNGPYFNDKTPTKNQLINEARWVNDKFHGLIMLDNQMVGMVSAYYDDGDLERWLDVGITIYREDLWGQHIGQRALTQWIDYLFNITNLPHIGFTTWSGNQRMMYLGDAIGMKLEGRIRKVRFWQNQYFDSIKYGILREEWIELQKRR